MLTTDLRISRCKPTRRGCRTSTRKQILIKVCAGFRKWTAGPVDQTRILTRLSSGIKKSVPEEGNYDLHIASYNIQNDTFGTGKENNLIVVKRSPLPSHTVKNHLLSLYSGNVRSIKSKSVDLLDYICNTNADMFASRRHG